MLPDVSITHTPNIVCSVHDCPPAECWTQHQAPDGPEPEAEPDGVVHLRPDGWVAAACSHCPYDELVEAGTTPASVVNAAYSALVAHANRIHGGERRNWHIRLVNARAGWVIGAA